MGGLISGLFGSKGKPGQIVDVTPEEFEQLRGPLTEALKGLISTQGGPGFPGAMTAPQSQFEGVLANQAFMQGQQPVGTFEQRNFLLNNLNAQQNPFATGAQMSDLERQILALTSNQAQAGGPQAAQAPGTQLRAPSPGQRTAAPRVADPSASQGAAQNLLAQILQGQFLTPDSNPFLQQTIAAAQRPLLESFQDVEMPRLAAQFTRAGQQIQPQSSSPFDRAAALSQRGLANALGDVSTRLAGENFAAERSRQMQALPLPEQFASQELQRRLAAAQAQEAFTQGDFARRFASTGMQDDLLGSAFSRELASVGQAAGLQGDAFARSLAGLEAAGLPRQVEQAGLDRQAGAFDAARQTGFQAQQGLQGLGEAELNRTMQAMQAVALPRMIEEMGVERGLAEFQRRIQTLMDALRTGGALAQTNTQSVEGTKGTTGALPGALAGFAGSSGGSAALAGLFGLSDRRLKSNIRRLGALPSGLGVYAYTLAREDSIGVMADEVQALFPHAVHEHASGYLMVDYARIG